MKKVFCIFCLVFLCLSLFGAVSVSAAETATFTANSTWPNQEAYFDVTVGCIYTGSTMGGATIEITYNATYFQYEAIEEGERYTEEIVADTPGLIKIMFFKSAGSSSFQQPLRFKVKNGVAVGSKGDISVKVLELSDTMGEPLACTGTPVSKTITVTAKPTPTPTPTTPAWTPSATTPAQTQAPTGTEEMDPSATPWEEETIEPSETPEASPTEAPVVTEKPIASPTATNDQALLIQSGALAFWMMVVLIVGIWIGIGVGYLIWGRRKGRAIRRSKIIGNDEF